MMIKLKSSNGFTVAELTIASTIFGFMTASLMFFTFSFNSMRYELQTKSKLTQDAKNTVEQIVWGMKTAGQPVRDGIWEAQDFTIVSATHLQYTDTAGDVHEVRQNGLKIEYQRDGGGWNTLHDPNGALADDANRYSTDLSFTQAAQANVVEIRLILGERNVERWDYVSTSTRVAFRN